jgi:hypothetical protein
VGIEGDKVEARSLFNVREIAAVTVFARFHSRDVILTFLLLSAQLGRLCHTMMEVR